MNTDIVRKIKFNHVKANFHTLASQHKFFLIIFLFSIVSTLTPHMISAQTTSTQTNGPKLVFDTGNTDYQDYLTQINLDLTDQYFQSQARLAILRQERLTLKLQIYLKEQGSPLADYASVLVSLRNWKKIVALANAESSMCEKFPVSTNNCWGVGGTSLWTMGNNLGEGIVAMNHFLNAYPKHSLVKYSLMTFEQMNGLYKQPPADHWVNNNQVVYDDLIAIEQSVE